MGVDECPVGSLEDEIQGGSAFLFQSSGPSGQDQEEEENGQKDYQTGAQGEEDLPAHHGLLGTRVKKGDPDAVPLMDFPVIDGPSLRVPLTLSARQAWSSREISSDRPVPCIWL